MMATVLFLLAQLAASPDPQVDALIQEIAHSGRILEFGDSTIRTKDPRLQLAPGAPPMLSFRYFAGMDRGRFGKLDLMMDDAGH